MRLTIENYTNDYCRNTEVITISDSPKALAKYIYNTRSTSSTNDPIYLPSDGQRGDIHLYTPRNQPTVFLHKIECNGTILFSSGCNPAQTSGKSFVSDWMKTFAKRFNNHEYEVNYAFGEPTLATMRFKED